MRGHRLALLASVLITDLVCGQVPAGYHLGTAIAVPDSLVEVLANGRFRATVVRAARNSQEREIIATAERLYPDSETLLGAARDATERERLSSMGVGVAPGAYKTPPRRPGNPVDRWWLDSFDATWLPFAVAGGAVDYYLGRLRDLAAGRGPFAYEPGQPPDHATFDYRASVRPTSQSGVASIVDLRITWTYWCGSLCAMSFTHSRTVSFDAMGAVVRIEGDERPLVSVS